jgi:transposase
MQADFATIRRGRDRLAVFIATLGWSRATYVEFVTDERLQTLLGCHERAFYFFGGVPREVLYDYVARHIIVFLCPSRLCCHQGREGPRALRRAAENGHIMFRASSAS